MFKFKPITAMTRAGTTMVGLVRKISVLAVLKRVGFLALGCAIIYAGLNVYLIGDSQYELYDLGMMAYDAASHAGEPGSPIHTEEQMLKVVGNARQLLEASRQAYKVNSQTDAKSWLHRFLSPQPDQHLAAMAAFQEAKIYLALNQPKLAVQSFRLYLQLNPGGSQDGLLGYQEDTYVDQYDLEMLLKANPSAGQGDGSGNGPGKPGNQPSNGNQAGKQVPTKL